MKVARAGALLAALVQMGGLPLAHAEQGLQLSARASLVARDRCQTRMHENAQAFRLCADALLSGPAPRSAPQRYTRLGTAYYAWLAATAAAKNGLPQAQAAALHFLAIFRPLQRTLAVDDAALCATIEGDCVARVARLRLMESELHAQTGKAQRAQLGP